MLLLELAVQAVRGFSPSVRVALKPGFVVLKSPAEAPAPTKAMAFFSARRCWRSLKTGWLPGIFRMSSSVAAIS